MCLEQHISVDADKVGHRGESLVDRVIITYRNITFRQTNTGYWIFDSYPPEHYGFWGHFFTESEQRLLHQPVSEEEHITIMKNGIDRFYAKTPVSK
jgi:hypothetical protein